MQINKIRFNNDNNRAFVNELRKRVNAYFSDNGITKYANTAMIIKTIIMILMLFIPYFVLLFGNIDNLFISYVLWIIMGFGVGGIGMSVMHDANHGAYSKHRFINRLIGRLLDLVGGNATNWKIQHNLLHHTYTNISGLDQDIESGVLMRLSPAQKRRKHHRYQHIYAWILYGFMTIQWMTFKDFAQMIEFRNKNLDKGKSRTFWKEYTLMVAAKIFYYTYMVVIPLIVLPFAWWQILIGIFLMQFTTGFTLATIFQLAHVMPSTTFAEKYSDIKEGTLESNWMVHQLETTTDFARNNKLISWYIGGLNFQVEHHLFPNICHIHYAKLSYIVEKTAKEFGVEYKNISTFRKALIEHGKVLKALGSQNFSY